MHYPKCGHRLAAMEVVERLLRVDHGLSCNTEALGASGLSGCVLEAFCVYIAPIAATSPYDTPRVPDFRKVSSGEGHARAVATVSRFGPYAQTYAWPPLVANAQSDAQHSRPQQVSGGNGPSLRAHSHRARAVTDAAHAVVRGRSVVPGSSPASSPRQAV
jgi:hypothetical protein